MITRRSFLKRGLWLPTGTGALSTLLNLELMSRAAAQTGGLTDNKALICLFFPGGLDSHNVLVPKLAPFTAGAPSTTSNTYRDYRGSLALAGPELEHLCVNADRTPSIGCKWLIHNKLKKLRASYSGFSSSESEVNGQLVENLASKPDRRLAFVAGVGTLRERSSGARLQGSPRVPQGLYSHYDQMLEWQTSVPRTDAFKGWGGRAIELLNSVSPNSALGIDIDGGQILLNGAQTSGVSVSGLFSSQTGVNVSQSSVIRQWVKQSGGFGDWRQQLKSRLNSAAQGSSSPELAYYNVLEQSLAERMSRTIDDGETFQGLLNTPLVPVSGGPPVPPAQTPSPVAGLAARIERAIRIVEGNRLSGSGPKRQVFFISTSSGWDHHNGLKGAMDSQLPDVDAAFEHFFALLEANPALKDKVVLFTASEFGRTGNANGDGSDHGWAGVQMVAGFNNGQTGSAEKGVRRGVFGLHPLADQPIGEAFSEAYPGLTVTNGGGLTPNEMLHWPSRKTAAPTVAVDDYFRDLAKWFLADSGTTAASSQLFELFPALKPGGDLGSGVVNLSGSGQVDLSALIGNTGNLRFLS